MTQKQRIKQAIENVGKELGIYHANIELLSKHVIKRIIEEATTGGGDIRAYINRKPYVVEVVQVGNELDVMLLTYEEYRNRYGINWNEI